MTLNEQIAELTANLSKLPARDLAFASSLIAQYAKRKQLSDKQIPYVAKLLERVQAQQTLPVNQPAEKPEAVAVGDFAGVVSLFKTAAVKLKWPKFTLIIDGVPVILRLAGQRSSAPGSVTLTGEGGFGERTYFGRVSPEGAFEMGFKVTPEFGDKLTAVLRDLATDPVKVVQEHARLTGHCVFCKLELSDARSKAAGFGETCAKNFGLHEQWKKAAKIGPQTLAAVA